MDGKFSVIINLVIALTGRSAFTEGIKGGGSAGEVSLRALPAPLEGEVTTLEAQDVLLPHSKDFKRASLYVVLAAETEHRKQKTVFKHAFSFNAVISARLADVCGRTAQKFLSGSKPPSLEARRP